MQGATQTWDGLRIHWERDPRAAAYEIIASDHQIFSEELADALAGRADFTTVAAVGPTVTCVIDNVTGLIWERQVDPGEYRQSDADNYCRGKGGDWRLPTRIELVKSRAASPSRVKMAVPLPYSCALIMSTALL